MSSFTLFPRSVVLIGFKQQNRANVIKFTFPPGCERSPFLATREVSLEPSSWTWLVFWRISHRKSFLKLEKNAKTKTCPKNNSDVKMSVVKFSCNLRWSLSSVRLSGVKITDDHPTKPTKGTKSLISNAALWPLPCEPCANQRPPATSQSRVMRGALSEGPPAGTKLQIKSFLNSFTICGHRKINPELLTIKCFYRFLNRPFSDVAGILCSSCKTVKLKRFLHHNLAR